MIVLLPVITRMLLLTMTDAYHGNRVCGVLHHRHLHRRLLPRRDAENAFVSQVRCCCVPATPQIILQFGIEGKRILSPENIGLSHSFLSNSRPRQTLSCRTSLWREKRGLWLG
jgi:hypothetical protein